VAAASDQRHYRAMQPRDIAVALAPPLLWGVGFTMAKPAVAHFPPLLMMTFAYGATAVALFRSAGALRTPWWTLAAFSVLGCSLQAALIFRGLMDIPASTAVLVIQAQAPLAVLSAWAFGRERLDWRRSAGMAVALLGVFLVAGAPEVAGARLSIVLVVLGGLSWAVAQTLIRVYGRDSGRRLAGTTALLAAPQCLLASLLFERDQIAAIATADRADWMALALFVALGFIFANSIWFHLLRRFRVDQVMPFTLLMPVVGVVTSALALGEAMSQLSLVGGAVVLFGLAVVVRAPAAAAALPSLARTASPDPLAGSGRGDG
jgi:O-acetylserine/cysteine efflux transporter